MRYLVLGHGASGRAAEALAQAQGIETVVLEGAAVPDVWPAGAFDRAIVSPGLALTHPLVAEASRRDIPLVSELQFGCEVLRAAGWHLLAVTGSKGKSSVAKLVAEALRGVACGNYGLPVCEVASPRNPATPQPRNPATSPWAVVEVSSFMLETTTLAPDAFEAAAILNLQADHLDRHRTLEAYHALKRKLLGFAKKGLEPSAAEALVPSVRNLFADSYFDNEVLAPNAAAAVWLLRQAGLDDASVAAAFRRFEPLPHRMNLVAERDGVRFVDDSKATSLAALGAGVAMCAPRPVRLIAGGRGKGDDPNSVLPPLTKGVEKVYLIGECAEKLFESWSGTVACERCGTLERATEAAMRDARDGETVLLSPGAASFDQFTSFGERGDAFARLVQKER